MLLGFMWLDNPAVYTSVEGGDEAFAQDRKFHRVQGPRTSNVKNYIPTTENQYYHQDFKWSELKKGKVIIFDSLERQRLNNGPCGVQYTATEELMLNMIEEEEKVYNSKGLKEVMKQQGEFFGYSGIIPHPAIKCTNFKKRAANGQGFINLDYTYRHISRMSIPDPNSYDQPVPNQDTNVAKDYIYVKNHKPQQSNKLKNPIRQGYNQLNPIQLSGNSFTNPNVNINLMNQTNPMNLSPNQHLA
jgi:hypothetical protein